MKKSKLLPAQLKWRRPEPGGDENQKYQPLIPTLKFEPPEGPQKILTDVQFPFNMPGWRRTFDVPNRNEAHAGPSSSCNDDFSARIGFSISRENVFSARRIVTDFHTVLSAIDELSTKQRQTTGDPESRAK